MTVPPLIKPSDVPPEVRSVLERLREQGHKAYLVGGCVRDLLLGKVPGDFDVATSARPEQVQRAFTKVIPTGIQHGTVTVLSRGHPVEVTTFRTEGEYLDGRRPSSIAFHEDISADLSRRDFTINAIAFDPVSGELVDPSQGQADLQARRIRCVGDPAARFSEDGLRPLRAVRFAAVLGFSLDPPTAQAIPQAIHVFRKVAAERVREEFVKLLLSARPAMGLDLLRTSGLLEVFLPELLATVGVEQGDRYAGDVYAHTLAAVDGVAPTLELRLAALLHDLAKPRTSALVFTDHPSLGAALSREILERLRFPTKVMEQVARLVRYHRWEEVASGTDGDLRRFAAQVGPENLPALFALSEANRRAYGKDLEQGLAALQAFRSRLERLLAEKPALTPRELALDGKGVMRVLGVPPSPKVGEATRFLMDRVFDDPSLNTPEKLAQLLAKWAEAQAP